MYIGKGDKTSGGLLSVSQCSDTTVTVVTSVSYASGQVFATTKKLSKILYFYIWQMNFQKFLLTILPQQLLIL